MLRWLFHCNSHWWTWFEKVSGGFSEMVLTFNSYSIFSLFQNNMSEIKFKTNVPNNRNSDTIYIYFDFSPLRTSSAKSRLHHNWCRFQKIYFFGSLKAPVLYLPLKMLWSIIKSKKFEQSTATHCNVDGSPTLCAKWNASDSVWFHFGAVSSGRTKL